MADKKISALTGATTPLAGTEVLPIVQSGATVKVAVSDLTAGRSMSASGLGVGTTSPLTTFGVNATNQVTDSFGMASFNTTDSQAANKGGQITLGGVVSGTSQTVFGAIAGRKESSTSGEYKGYLQFSTINGTSVVEAARIDSTGNFIPAIAAKGINFTANTPAAGMTSQLLNWYEEGTWTPSIGWGGSGSVTTTTALGRYRRIGSEVTVWASVFWSASSASGGFLSINGAPFTPNSTTNYFTVGTVISTNLTYVGQIGGQMNAGNASIYLTSCSTAAASVTLTGSALGVAGGNILLTMVYHL
jgi:hypothetical protein